MDPFTLSKIGNVTIQRIPPKLEDATEDCPDSAADTEPTITNPPSLPLPKLPPSINITVKSTSNSPAEVDDNGAPKDDDIVSEGRDAAGDRLDHVPDQNEPPEPEESVSVSTETSDTEICDTSKGSHEGDGVDNADAEYVAESPEQIAVDAPEYTDAEYVAESPEPVAEDAPNTDTEYVAESAEPTAVDTSDNMDAEYVTKSPEQTTVDAAVEDETEAEKMELEEICENQGEESQCVDKESEVESELPVIKDEFMNSESQEYRDDGAELEGGTVVPADELPEVPVAELIGGELPEDMMCKEEQFSEKENDSSSEDADDELDDAQKDGDDANVIKKKKKRKTKSEGETDESSSDVKKQKTTSSGMWIFGT